MNDQFQPPGERSAGPVDLPPAQPHARAPAGYYGGGHVMPEAEVHLVNLLRVVYKRRWPALVAFVIVLGSVMLYTFTATPLYQATVQVLIETENPNVVKFEEVYNPGKE